jgi:hypothetical protein
MRPIEVFYHLYIPPDDRATNWTWCVDQQLGLIKQTKLSNIAKINMAITMPVNWISIYNIPFYKNNSPSQHFSVGALGNTLVHNSETAELNFEGKVREYINLRYPFVNIIEVRDLIEPNLFEGQTLTALYQACWEKDIDVLYIHSKGVSSSSASVAAWREILNHFCIAEWTQCVKLLETCDVVGVKDLVSCPITMSGNFWWSKSSHVRKLPPPLQAEYYYEEIVPGTGSYRYAFERWIMSCNPAIHHIVDTKTDHFTNYCFLENLLKNNS